MGAITGITRRLAFLLAVGGVCGILTACGSEECAPAEEEDDTPIPLPTIEGVTHGGPGCPSWNVGNLGFDQASTTMIIRHSEMELSHPPGPPVQHTFCSIGIGVGVPSGWQLAAGGAAARGDARLPDGARAEQTTKTYFAGMPTKSVATTRVSGPEAGAHGGMDRFAEDEIAWSACGASTIFTVETSLTLNVAASTKAGASIDVTKVEIPVLARRCQ